MSHDGMTTAAQKHKLATEVSSPIPPNPLRPRHMVVVLRMLAAKVKFQIERRLTMLADSTQLPN